MDLLMAKLPNLLRLLVSWAFLSVGLWAVSGKLKWKKRWMAWVPGLRYAALGDSLEMDLEGIFCGMLDVPLFLAQLMNLPELNERAEMALALLILVLALLLFIYRIRLFLRLLTAFNARKLWLLPWFIADWLPLLILGASKKYQLREDFRPAEEESKPGTAPAQIPGTGGAAHTNARPESGLSIELRQRTVRDFARKRYLLKDISLDIPNGSLVLLLGGSGSGKTTFVNAVIGYEKADAEILLNGADVYRDYGQMKYRIGFVPQQNLIRGSDTVIRTVSDAAELRLPAKMSGRNRRARVAEVLDLLGLSAGKEGLVSKKSGGQLRRISIAMELVSDLELFVLDEPDSGLDGVIARELFTKLRTIADSGKIVIAITHTPDRVVDLFDKVIVLARDSGRVGRLAFYGSPDEAKRFFGKDSMEGIVMSVNRKEEGGEGLADTFIERYARLTAAEGEGAVS